MDLAQPTRSETGKCATCGGAGTFFGPLPDRDYWQDQICPYCAAGEKLSAEMRQRYINKLFGAAMIPTRFSQASVDDYPRGSTLLDDAVKAVDSGHGLMIWGRRGVGKTHLSVVVLKRRLSEGVPSLFVYVPDMLSRVRDAYSGRGPSAYELVEGVKNIDLLVLDDLGKERVTDWAREQLHIIINHRYAWQKQTVCTSQLGRKALEEHIGDSAVSRLGEMCSWMHIAGRDRRTEKMNQEVEHANA